MPHLTVSAGGRNIELDIPHGSRQNLLQVIYLSGYFEAPPLCAGLSLCGRCRVRFLPQSSEIPDALPEDLKALGKELTVLGWRLACRHQPIAAAWLELPPEIRLLHSGLEIKQGVTTEKQSENNIDVILPGSGGKVALAVDFGSTSLHYAAVTGPLADQAESSAGTHKENQPGDEAKSLSGDRHLLDAAKTYKAIVVEQGESCTSNVKFSNTESCEAGFATAKKPSTGFCSDNPKVVVNPQMGAGSDIISRLAFASKREGLARLSELSKDALRRMVREQSEIGLEVEEICLAANPSMTYLLLGREVSGLAAAPYRLDYAGGVEENLPELPPIWIAPLMGPFMGGDLSAGYAALAWGWKTGVEELPGLSPIVVDSRSKAADSSKVGNSVSESKGDLKCAGCAAGQTGSEASGTECPADASDHESEAAVKTDPGIIAPKNIYPFLLADLGTNGEFILALDEKTTLASSIPLGPALEGIGMRFGSEARPGVITGFRLGRSGLEAVYYPVEDSGSGAKSDRHQSSSPFAEKNLGGAGQDVHTPVRHEASQAQPDSSKIGYSGQSLTESLTTNSEVQGQRPTKTSDTSPSFGPQSNAARPAGLSGTAYLSLAHILLSQGIIGPEGLFAARRPVTPLGGLLWPKLEDSQEGRIFRLEQGMYLTGSDIEELLKIKAAFSLGIKMLLDEAGLAYSGLKALYLAGSLGIHADTSALEGLGLVPPGGAARLIPAGNTSLAGAALLCQRPELRQRLVDWASRVRVLSLTDSGDFQGRYTGEMQFIW